MKPTMIRPALGALSKLTAVDSTENTPASPRPAVTGGKVELADFGHLFSILLDGSLRLGVDVSVDPLQVYPKAFERSS